MLRKRERLGRRAFQEFFKKGSRRHSPLLTLIVSPHQEFHASVVISKKIAKGAVVRNKLRRRVYALLAQEEKVRSHGGVYICIMKQEALHHSYTSLKSHLHTLINKHTS